MSIEATTKNFDELLIEHPVALVDFWAPWCAPCKAIKPLLSKIEDRITVITVDASAEPELARRYDVRQIPNLLLFRAGSPVKAHVGALTMSQLEDFIQ